LLYPHIGRICVPSCVMTRTHAALAVLVALVLPGYSWLDGSGWLAWTMFSKSESYRLRIVVTDRDHRKTLVNPSGLARGANTQSGLYLSGAEHFRHAPMSNSFAANLGGLATLACRAVPAAARAHVALDSRRNLDAPVQTTSAEVSCP
jgi:hypothetical protein